MKPTKLPIFALLLSQSFLWADLQFDGETRLRFEYFNNMNEKFYGSAPKLGESDDGCLFTRLRLGMTYQFDEQWTARLSMQDSRVLGWGFEDQDWYNKEFMQEHNPQKDTLELYETYLQYATPHLTLKAGRQKITYGDGRVFGPGEWKNSGKWIWDAVKVSFKDEGDFLDFFYGGTMLHEPDEFSLDHRHGYYGGGMYGHYAYGKTGAIEPIFAYKENKTANENYRSLQSYYAGARMYDTDLYGYFYDMTCLKSFGEYTKLDATAVDIDGFGFHLDGGYHFKGLYTKLGLGYTYASGNDPDTLEHETFDAAFGASDVYYGRLNLMSWSNLKDYEIFAIIEPLPKTNIKLEYHAFYADEPSAKWMSYTIPSMQSDKYGDEIDIVVAHQYSPSVHFLAGIGYFKSGDFIKEAGLNDTSITDDDAYGLFTQVSYKF
ncbi:MAG: hypothetical protein QG564_1528 [Campylobacterota bacterium]|nr:hypothetical protein [Campylobacterota bacterium]